MSQSQDIVYYEDLEVTAKKGPATVVAKSATTKSSSLKRQLNISDMFNGPAKKENGPSATKRLKLEPTSSLPASQESNASQGSQSGPQKLNSIPFSLSAYLELLSEEEKRLLELECECMGKSWLKVLKDEIKKPYFLALKRFLWEEGVRGPKDVPPVLKVYPSPKDIYAWSKIPLGTVRLVIIGQDPYHGKGQAHGLCFSVPKGVKPPPSLQNIYKEIKAEYPEFAPPSHGNLSSWAKNGVLMLNTCLTVRASEAGSHSKRGWEDFTNKVVEVVDKYGGANLPRADGSDSGVGAGVVFLAWGSWAAQRVAKLSKNKHLILTSAHPSPFAAHKGFFGNGHFKAANDWLEKRYGPEGVIDWCRLNGDDCL